MCRLVFCLLLFSLAHGPVEADDRVARVPAGVLVQCAQQWVANMNFDDNFRRIGSANIEPDKALVEALTDEDWNQESVRQQRYEVHKDTQSIPLVHGATAHSAATPGFSADFSLPGSPRRDRFSYSMSEIRFPSEVVYRGNVS